MLLPLQRPVLLEFWHPCRVPRGAWQPGEQWSFVVLLGNQVAELLSWGCFFVKGRVSKSAGIALSWSKGRGPCRIVVWGSSIWSMLATPYALPWLPLRRSASYRVWAGWLIALSSIYSVFIFHHGGNSLNGSCGTATCYGRALRSHLCYFPCFSSGWRIWDCPKQGHGIPL